MVITNYNYNEAEQDYDGRDLPYSEEDKELYKQKKHNTLYKILKRNPFDMANDVMLKVLKSFGLRDKFHELSWWAATIWAKEAMRRLWNHKYQYVGGQLFPEYGGAILVGNHVSHLDPFFLGGSVHRPVYWMSKEENFQILVSNIILIFGKNRKQKIGAKKWKLESLDFWKMFFFFLRTKFVCCVEIYL